MRKVTTSGGVYVVGNAFDQPDGSIHVALDALPRDGKLVLDPPPSAEVLEGAPGRKWYTVVGTRGIDSRYAEYVEAKNWQEAARSVTQRLESDGHGRFVLAGVFIGKHFALDEQ